ncbi:hypothetical protein ACJX0J_029840, partial [Zea mays]
MSSAWQATSSNEWVAEFHLLRQVWSHFLHDSCIMQGAGKAGLEKGHPFIFILVLKADVICLLFSWRPWLSKVLMGHRELQQSIQH